MNQYLNENLLDGEKVLWEGKSERLKILSGPYAKTLPRVWTISGIVLALFAVWYVLLIMKTGFSVSQFLITAVLVGIVPVSLCFHSVSDCNIIQRDLTYVLTNYRAIILGGHDVKSMRITEDTEYRIDFLFLCLKNDRTAKKYIVLFLLCGHSDCMVNRHLGKMILQ